MKVFTMASSEKRLWTVVSFPSQTTHVTSQATFNNSRKPSNVLNSEK